MFITLIFITLMVITLMPINPLCHETMAQNHADMHGFLAVVSVCLLNACIISPD